MRECSLLRQASQKRKPRPVHDAAIATPSLLPATQAFLYSQFGQSGRFQSVTMATWRSGYAAVCKTVYPGSIPGVASTHRVFTRPSFNRAVIKG